MYPFILPFMLLLYTLKHTLDTSMKTTDFIPPFPSPFLKSPNLIRIHGRRPGPRPQRRQCSSWVHQWRLPGTRPSDLEARLEILEARTKKGEAAPDDESIDVFLLLFDCLI